MASWTVIALVVYLVSAAGTSWIWWENEFSKQDEVYLSELLRAIPSIVIPVINTMIILVCCVYVLIQEFPEDRVIWRKKS